MALTPGSRVGPFEILGSLGAGGMGEVYHGAVTVSRDGQRVLIVEYPYAAGQTLHVLTNWHARIK